MEHYWRTHLWWAIEAGRKSSFYLNVYYEYEWETPVTQLRQRLGIPEPPYTPQKARQSVALPS